MTSKLKEALQNFLVTLKQRAITIIRPQLIPIFFLLTLIHLCHPEIGKVTYYDERAFV